MREYDVTAVLHALESGFSEDARETAVVWGRAQMIADVVTSLLNQPNNHLWSLPVS